MIRERTSAGSSARIKSSLRKKLQQALPRQQIVACGRRFCRIFRGSAEDKVLPQDDAKDLAEPSSVGSRGRSFRSFFCRNPRKNLPHFFRGSSRSPFPTRRRRFFSRKNLHLQPPAINVVYPKVPTAIYTIHAIEIVTRRLED